MVQQKKQKKTKVYGKIFSMRLRLDIMNGLHEEAEREQRTDSNMGQVLISEALKARGVNFQKGER
jgi:hypothetical protein